MAEDLKIQIITEADNSGFKSAADASADLSREMGVVNVSTAEVEKAMKAGDSATDGFNLKGREMKKVLNELNTVIPGLGHAIEGVEKALTSGAGGFMVVVLAIEAMKTYWELYKEAAERAAAAQAAAFDKIRETTRSARQEMEDFATAKDKALKPDDEEAAKLANDQTILAAQFRGKREILKAEQNAAMESAQTPEQKAAVQKSFTEKAKDLDAQEQNAKLALLNGTIEKLTEKIGGLESNKSELVDERSGILAAIKTLNKLGLSTDSETAKLNNVNERIKTVDEQIIEATQKKTRYAGQAATDQAVINIDAFARKETEAPVIARAVREGGLNLKPGEEATASQREANAALTQVFSQFNGGIQTMIAVIRAQQAKGASQDQQIQALKNAQQSMATMSHR